MKNDKYEELQKAFKKYATHTNDCRASWVDGYESCICGFSKYEQDSFEKTLERASEIVLSWPEWKQNALGNIRPQRKKGDK